MRVLCGGPTRETESEMFALHSEGLRAQAAADLEVVLRHETVPDPGGPRWFHEKIERVAKVRQEFLERVDKESGGAHITSGWALTSYPSFDALLLVDSDVILGPGVLERMWQVDADVVYGVFFTRADWGNAPGIDTWPNVWDAHPYRFTEECWNELVAPGVNEVEVLGGGACTLIRGRGFESRYWPLLESIRFAGGMWGGEDRAFNLGLEARGIRQVAVTGLPIVHLYTDAHRTPEMVAEARERVGLFARVPD